MKNLTSYLVTIAFVIFSAFTVKSQNVLWSEDFEGNWLNNWYAEQGIWEAGVPTSGPGAAYSGDNCAATILGGNYPTNSSSRFIRIPSFTVPDASQSPRLRFWHWYNFASGASGRVQIKEVGTTDWITISPTYIGTGGGVWTYPLIDLSEYANKIIQLAFNFQSGSYYTGPGWYIDDIALITGPVSLVLPEGFESGLGDWYAETGNWEVGTPISGPGSAYNGVNCAATILGGNYSTSISSRLISPPITLPDASQSPRLRFWHWYNFASGASGRVQIKEVGTEDWIPISPTYSGTGGGVWTYPSIDLSEYANTTVQLAFFFQSGSYYISPGWYIDDIDLITGPTSLEFPEGFESGLGDWYAETGTWEVGSPISGPGSAYNGVNCAATILGGNYSTSISSRLVSPSITISDVIHNPRLRFWHWYNFASGASGRVQIKEVGTLDWIPISPPYGGTGGGVWTYPSIDLSEYANTTVQFAFYFQSGSYYTGPGWYIDDIIVEGLPTAIDENSTERSFTIFPNPFSHSTTISFKDPNHHQYTLRVFNLSGEIVFHQSNITTANIHFERSNLPNGVYIIELKGEDTFRGKMIVK